MEGSLQIVFIFALQMGQDHDRRRPLTIHSVRTNSQFDRPMVYGRLITGWSTTSRAVLCRHHVCDRNPPLRHYLAYANLLLQMGASTEDLCLSIAANDPRT